MWVAIVALMALGWWLGSLFGPDDLDAELAAARSAAAAAESEARGFETRVVEVEEELVAAYASMPDTSASHRAFREEVAGLAAEIELLTGRVTSITEMYTSLRDQVVFESTETVTEDGEVAEIRGGLDEPGLRLRVAYLPPTEAFRLDELGVAGALIVSELPDGSQMVSARAQSPRIAFSGLETVMAAPIVVSQCSLGTRVTWGGVGLGIGAVAGLIGGVAR